jgi:hypothetical protein
VAAGTIDDLARALQGPGVDTAAWREWVGSDAADATLVRELLAATEALVRGAIDREAYESRIAALWTYWRGQLDALPPDDTPGG